MKNRWNRRDLLRAGLLGGVGSAFALEQLGGVPLLGTWFSDKVVNPAFAHLDAYHLMGDALRGGAAMLRVHEAMAQGEDDWTLVQIKVLNHVHTPLVFHLADTALKVSAGGKGGATTAMLQAQAEVQSDIPRWQNLKLNKWFADRLQNGTTDGLAPAAGNTLGLSTGADDADVGEFPAEEEVALQAFLQLQQVNPAGNHSLRNCKIRDAQPDLTLFCQDKGLIKSPLGITCFMMGVTYDKAEGQLGQNAILGANGETEIIGSKTVADYVAQIQQYVNAPSYADRASIEQNVIYKLDQIVVKEPILRRELINSIQKFKSGLGSLGSSADIASTRQTKNDAAGNNQSAVGANGTNGVGASGEFVGQCKYVSETLKLTGQPLRNFSLFLNIADIDGNTIDNATINGIGLPVEAYSYVEGMRQLAMGLNVLGRAIKRGAKMMVVVTSEGGRDANLGDSKTSFAFVMGPGGAGKLKDNLYASMSALEAGNGPALTNPGSPAGAVAWGTDDLKEADGNKSTAVTTTGDVQLGVVEFLEEMTGSDNVRGELAGSDGRFVKLKRA